MFFKPSWSVTRNALYLNMFKKRERRRRRRLWSLKIITTIGINVGVVRREAEPRPFLISINKEEKRRVRLDGPTDCYIMCVLHENKLPAGWAGGRARRGLLVKTDGREKEPFSRSTRCSQSNFDHFCCQRRRRRRSLSVHTD